MLFTWREFNFLALDDLENQKFQCFKKKYLGSKNSWGFPDGSVVESACHVGDGGLIPGLERSSGEGNDNPLHYSCLGNHMARGAWQATVHGVTKSWTQLSDTTTTKRNAYNKVKKKWGASLVSLASETTMLRTCVLVLLLVPIIYLFLSFFVCELCIPFIVFSFWVQCPW